MRENAAFCVVVHDVAEVTWRLLTDAWSSIYSIAKQCVVWDEARRGEARHRQKHRSLLLRNHVLRFLHFNSSCMGQLCRNNNTISMAKFAKINRFTYYDIWHLPVLDYFVRILKLVASTGIWFSEDWIQLTWQTTIVISVLPLFLKK
jgi:hypothetical protein